MNILVTGGAGYIGSVTADKLLEAGHTVFIVDDLSEGHREAIPQGSTFFKVNLLDSENLEHIFAQNTIDAVMHFAGKCLVSESMQNPGKYFLNNVYGGINLLNCMVKSGTRKIVFSSTCATYGIPGKMPMDETTSKNPVNPYGESKLMFETILEWHRKIHDIQYVALRYFNAAGASRNFGEDHDPETHLIPNIFLAALGKTPSIQIFGSDYPTKDGTCVRDYIHIEDIAAAHIQALEYKGSNAFNLGNGEGFSVKEIIKTARDISSIDIPVTEAPRREGDPPVLIANARKAAEELGWVPKKPSISEILEDAWAWHKRYPEGYGMPEMTNE